MVKPPWSWRAMFQGQSARMFSVSSEDLPKFRQKNTACEIFPLRQNQLRYVDDFILTGIWTTKFELKS
jgi:hypothetical protein